MCVSDTGVSPNMGDQYWPIRMVVRPFVRSTNANRIRICGCSSPNGGAPLNAPKKSLSSTAFGAHLPSTGPAVKVKLMRVLRTSPSVKSLSVVGWLAGGAANSAFCPWPNPPNRPWSVNRVAFIKPLMGSVCPSPNFTTCWAVARDPTPRVTTAATASPENDANRVLTRSPSCERWLPCRLGLYSDPRAAAPLEHPLSLHGAHGEALDEAVDEQVIDDGERDAREQRSRHQGPPVVDVTPHQRDRDSQAHRHPLHRADEGQGVHEFLHHQGEREDDHRQDPRDDEPGRDLQDDREAAVAVDHRLLLDLPRHRAEEAHHEPRAERDRHGRIDQDQRAQGVLEAEQGDEPRERDEQERGGDEIGEEDAHPHSLPPAAGEPGQAVAGRHGHGHGDGDDGHDHHQRVQDPAGELGLPEQQPHVFESGRVVEDPRHVPRVERADVEVAVLFERREQHPVEREPRERHEARRRGVERHALHRAPTSARRARRSIATATTMRNGSRNTAIAAPWPKSAPSTPRWNARVGSTWVVFAGPPPVRM